MNPQMLVSNERRSALSAVLANVALLLGSIPAQAVVVSGVFTGVVQQAGFTDPVAAASSGITAGSPLTGKFSFDTAAQPPNISLLPLESGAYIFNGGAQFSITVNGIIWSSGARVTVATERTVFEMQA